LHGSTTTGQKSRQTCGSHLASGCLRLQEKHWLIESGEHMRKRSQPEYTGNQHYYQNKDLSSDNSVNGSTTGWKLVNFTGEQLHICITQVFYLWP